MYRHIVGAAILIAASLFSQPDAGAQSKWLLTKTKNCSFEQLYAKDSTHIYATECGKAYLEANKCKDLKTGDCWTFHIPVEKVNVTNNPIYVEFDIMLCNTRKKNKLFALEYKEGKRWKSHSTVKCVGGMNEPATVIATIAFSETKKNKDELLIRLRALDDSTCTMKLMPYGYIGGYIKVKEGPAPKDTIRMGYLGNSFTFVNNGDFILKELAWSEGHFLDMNVSTYPGARFRSHFTLEGSMDVITNGGHELFILQDQSQQAARYGRDTIAGIMDYTKTISNVIRYFSPNVKFILEQTWAYSDNNFGGFGSYEAFDSCSTVGATKMAKEINAEISPIAKAFAIVRSERPDIELYSGDNSHPAAFGAYLKACVNYVTIFHTPLTESSKDSNFALDNEKCAYLRTVANRLL